MFVAFVVDVLQFAKRRLVVSDRLLIWNKGKPISKEIFHLELDLDGFTKQNGEMGNFCYEHIKHLVSNVFDFVTFQLMEQPLQDVLLFQKVT